MEKPNIAQNERPSYFKQMFPIESRLDLKFNHWGLISARARGWDEQTVNSWGLAGLTYRMGSRGPSHTAEWACALSEHYEPVCSAGIKTQGCTVTGLYERTSKKLHKETLSASLEVPLQDVCDIYPNPLLIPQGQWHPSLCSQHLAREPPQDRCAMPLAWTNFCSTAPSVLCTESMLVCML